jgi:hypothetical protein
MAELDEVPGTVSDIGKNGYHSQSASCHSYRTTREVKKMIFAEIGIMLFLFGSCFMDSADLRIPATICLIGVALTAIGTVKGGRA